MLVFLGRDTWFALFMTAAVAPLAHYVRRSGSSQRGQLALLALAAACLLFGCWEQL